MFRALCAHHQEVKIVLYSIWYHGARPVHRLREDSPPPPSRAEAKERVESRLVHRLREKSSLNLHTGRPPTGVMIPDAV
jgi:hypothetical protein